MAIPTATIRVPRETRDLLAAQARARGVSVAQLLGDIARQAEQASMMRSEREATLADAANPAIQAEEEAWAVTLDDGIG